VIHFEARGQVGVATIDRPERRNALNAELCAQLRGHLEQSGALRAIVITGAGTAFCSGADLVTRFAADGDATTDTFRPAFEQVLDAIVATRPSSPGERCRRAGMQLAVRDLHMRPTATLGIPAAKLGIILSSANVRCLTVLVGQVPPAPAVDRAIDVDGAPDRPVQPRRDARTGRWTCRRIPGARQRSGQCGR
jgi:enoyl-CoA hydratase